MPNDQSWNVAAPRLAQNISLLAAYVALAAPAISASAASSSSITISLTSPVTGATLYILERSTDGQAFQEIRNNMVAGEFPYTDADLTAETTYYYRAFAANETYTSEYSGVTSDETPAEQGGGGGGAFTPLLTMNFAGTSVGTATAVGDGWYKGDYVSSPVKSGNRALRLRRAVTQTGQCPYGTGALFYGGRHDLPQSVPVGYTIWMRYYVYFPAGFSFGYLYSGGDSGTMNSCGLGEGSDGSNNAKFMVLAPSGGTARTYVMLPQVRRQVNHPSPFLRIDTEAASGENIDFPYTFKFNQWCAFQMAVKVASNSTGWVRLWVDDEFIGETTGHATVSGSGNSIAEWGIGDYWNGYPWTDGTGDRGPFYLDEVIIATDMPGYGAPTGVDSGGRTFIHPNTTVGDLL